MHRASSANRTWSELRSASEYTATVGIPSSLHAQMTRRAISPRLATRILRNIIGGGGYFFPLGRLAKKSGRDFTGWPLFLKSEVVFPVAPDLVFFFMFMSCIML